MSNAESNGPCSTLSPIPPELLTLVASELDVSCLAKFAAASTACLALARGELRAALPASVEVSRSLPALFVRGLPPLFKGLLSVDTVKARASLVWRAITKDPRLYALTPAMCERLEESVVLPLINVTFRESTPLHEYPYDAHYGPVGLGPYSSTTDMESTAGADAGDAFWSAKSPNGVRCVIIFRQDDCSLFVRSNLMHELTSGFRKLIHWQCRRDGSFVAPWTRDTGARDKIVELLRSQQLWGSMMLDDTSKGLHLGFVLEHKLNGGIVVSMLHEGHYNQLHGLSFLGDADGSALPSAQQMAYALVETRTLDQGNAFFFHDATATFTGRQVLSTDTDIDAVRKRPLLTWKAPWEYARFRNSSCCLGDPPGTRVKRLRWCNGI